MPGKNQKTAEDILTGPCTGTFRERWGPEIYADRVDEMWKDKNPMLKKASVDHLSKACGYEAAKQIEAKHDFGAVTVIVKRYSKKVKKKNAKGD